MQLGFWALMYNLLDVECIAPPLDLLGSLTNLDDIPRTRTPVSLLSCLRPYSQCCLQQLIQSRRSHSLIMTELNSFTCVAVYHLPVYALLFSLPKQRKTRYKAPFAGLP